MKEMIIREAGSNLTSSLVLFIHWIELVFSWVVAQPPTSWNLVILSNMTFGDMLPSEHNDVTPSHSTTISSTMKDAFYFKQSPDHLGLFSSFIRSSIRISGEKTLSHT